MSKNYENLTYISEARAAKILNVQTKTLQYWRYKKIGPKHLEPKPRTIRYLVSDVYDWLNSKNGGVK